MSEVFSFVAPPSFILADSIFFRRAVSWFAQSASTSSTFWVSSWTYLFPPVRSEIEIDDLAELEQLDILELPLQRLDVLLRLLLVLVADHEVPAELAEVLVDEGFLLVELRDARHEPLEPVVREDDLVLERLRQHLLAILVNHHNRLFLAVLAPAPAAGRLHCLQLRDAEREGDVDLVELPLLLRLEGLDLGLGG